MALTDNLVAYWKLDESSGNPADSVGGFTLTNTNTVGYASALINNGADFGTANTNKYFVRADALGLNLDADFSLSMWIKGRTEIASGKDHSIFTIADSARDVAIRSYYLYNAGTPCVLFQRARNFVAFDGFTYNITLGTSAWHHLVVRYDAAADTLTGYLDNTSTGSVSSPGTGNDGYQNRTTFGLGFNESTGTYESTGANMYYDEIAVWSRVITPTEVASLYNSGAGWQYPFSAAYSMAAALGTFALTGIAAALIRGYTIVAAPGTYTLTGINALFTKTLTMALSAGTYTLTGIDAALSRGYGIAASVGAYTLTGIDTAFTKALTMAGALGTYTLTGVAATFSKGISLVAGVGSFVLTGFAVRFPLIFTPRTKNTTSYTSRTKNATTFSATNKNTTTYTPRDKSNI